MRGIWVDANNDLDPAKAKAVGATDAAFDIRDPRVTSAYLAGVRGRGIQPWIYACSQGDEWPDASVVSGPAWATWISDQLKRFTPNSATNPCVILNCETHDPSWIRAMLQKYRQLRPTRVTAWSPESHQSPLFAGIVKDIIAANVTILPQCYVGPMQRVESANEVLSWASLGIPAARIEPMLDAAQMGAWWDGWAFTMGRLPS